MPQTTAHLTEDQMGKCILQVSWIAPNNIAIQNLSRFIISVTNSSRPTTFNVTSTNNETLFSVSYPVCSCNPHNVSVSAINLCGREGQPSLNIIVDSDPLGRDLVCENIDTTGTAYDMTGPRTPDTPRSNSECITINNISLHGYAITDHDS